MKQDLKRKKKEIACFRVQELCESRGGLPGFPSLTVRMDSGHEARFEEEEEGDCVF